VPDSVSMCAGNHLFWGTRGKAEGVEVRREESWPLQAAETMSSTPTTTPAPVSQMPL